jgi:peptidoglycan/xylan/chitin deacetylase (PgdA/CDA1 family)
LALYYYGTWPYRCVYRAAARARGTAPLCVLFYHRVADTQPNPWTISNAQFHRQILWLRRHVELISLAEVQRRLSRGRNDWVAASITFDDGYAENCQQALPLLVKLGVPCTYFVSLDFVLHGTPFPHDVGNGHPLSPNTVAQLRQIARQGIEIGAHSRTHANLGQVQDPDALYDEVVAARDELQQLVGCAVRYFAFPFGLPEHLNPAVFELARDAGLKGVCSAYGAYNFPGQDPFHLRRIHGDPQLLRLKNWLTLDPRKMTDTARPPRLTGASKCDTMKGATRQVPPTLARGTV